MTVHPQPLDEDIIQHFASTVHTDFDAMVLEDLHESLVGVLCPMVGVKDFWTPLGDKGLFQRTDAKG